MKYSLTAEEYILALVIIGGDEAALSVQQEAFGAVSKEEMEYRLDSAMNGLLSKNLISINTGKEKLQSDFEHFLMGLTNTPRVIRCQINDQDELIGVSVFLNKVKTVQKSLYNSRVHHMFEEDNEQALSELLNISFITKEQSHFVIEESDFEELIDQLLNGQQINNELLQNLDTDFVETLKSKNGKLDTIVDYNLNQSRVQISSSLYISGREQTWLLQEGESGKINIQTFSFSDLLNLELI